jgi:hypothetical protein
VRQQRGPPPRRWYAARNASNRTIRSALAAIQQVASPSARFSPATGAVAIGTRGSQNTRACMISAWVGAAEKVGTVGGGVTTGTRRFTRTGGLAVVACVSASGHGSGVLGSTTAASQRPASAAAVGMTVITRTRP